MFTCANATTVSMMTKATSDMEEWRSFRGHNIVDTSEANTRERERRARENHEERIGVRRHILVVCLGVPDGMLEH